MLTGEPHHSAALKQYFRGLIVTLLTRMQTSKTDKYVYHFVYFLGFCLAINSEGLTPDYIVGEIEAIQPQYVGSFSAGLVCR